MKQSPLDAELSMVPQVLHGTPGWDVMLQPGGCQAILEAEVAGATAWDTFMTLAATTQKLGISFFAYLADRLHQAGRIPPLADLIHERASTLNLNASWTPA